MRGDDGEMVVWQWQRKIGSSWSRINLPCIGDGYSKPLHDKKWHQTAGGQCWQRWGHEGFMNEEDAMLCLQMVIGYIKTDIKYQEWRLAKIQISKKTDITLHGKCKK